MFYDRDELRLLSRGGRVPPAVRAVPRNREPTAGPGGQPWLLQAVATALGGIRGPGRSPGPSAPAAGYVDPEGYLELEFAVGFVAEDDPWPGSTP